MKFTNDRAYSDLEKAARRILEIANSVESVQGRMHKARNPLADVRKLTHNGLPSEPPITFLNCGNEPFPGFSKAEATRGWTKVPGPQLSLLRSLLRDRIHSLGRPYDPRARWRQLLFSFV